MTLFDVLRISPFIIGFVLTLVVVARTRFISTSGMFFRNVEENKKKGAIVELGGVTLFPILLIALCSSLGLPKWIGFDSVISNEVEYSSLRIMQVIAGCALMYIVGLKNDIHGTSSFVKFIALLAASTMFPITHLWITNLQGIMGVYEIPMGVGIPLSILLVIFITEVVSLLDDLDGLGMGLVTIMMAMFCFFGIYYDFTLGTLVAAAGLGVAMPYSLLKMFKKDWRKIIVGKAGSYVLGYLLSYLTLSYAQQSCETMPEGMLMVCIGITMLPMLEVVRTLRQRVREQRSIHTPDRNQIQHRLFRMGIPSRIVPIVIAFIMIFITILNAAWVIKGYNVTALAVCDILLWILMQSICSFVIARNEAKHHYKKWEMAYGREAWEANPPVEQIKTKHKNFGTMGLPDSIILGKEEDFIPDGMGKVERSLKRAVDCVTSAILMVVFSPLFLLSYILIKIDDGGPAIYSQERIGRYGRPFNIYKFRSMRLDAEKMGPALSTAGGDNDPRLTKVGKFLRAHHLDELPQLWNVFRGDMAFIGYRPERQFFIDQILEHDPRYTFLYQIRPGVTSYATLYNGYTDTMEKMLRRLSYDLYYLEHRSWWLDMRILALTFLSIVSGKKF